MVAHASMKSIHLGVSAQVAGKESCVTRVSTTQGQILTVLVHVSDDWHINNNEVVFLFCNYRLLSVVFRRFLGSSSYIPVKGLLT